MEPRRHRLHHRRKVMGHHHRLHHHLMGEKVKSIPPFLHVAPVIKDHLVHLVHLAVQEVTVRMERTARMVIQAKTARLLNLQVLLLNSA